MKENTVMLCAIGALLLIMLMAWIINLVRAAKNKRPLRWLGRVVYIRYHVCRIECNPQLAPLRKQHRYLYRSSCDRPLQYPVSIYPVGTAA